MIVDRYTKAVLTVIAASLLWLCALQAGRPVEAQQKPPEVAPGPPQPIVIVGWGTMDAEGRITLIRTPRGITDSNLPVKVTALPPGPVDVRLPYSDVQPLPVGVSQVKPVGPWEPLRVSVEDAPVRTRPVRGGE